MFPSIVIGIGGTGKWVLTDLKKSILEKESKIPDKVRLISFDVTDKDEPPVVRSWFNLENGKVEDFMLDYDPSRNEFYNFSGNLTEVLNELKKNPDTYPYIKNWLRKEDAEYFEGKVTTELGAGQIRQLSRLSFFLNAEDVFSRIYNAVREITSKRVSNEPILSFITSSFAGGTGCGTFIDFANLIHYAFEKIGVARDQYYLFGIFVLPRGFEEITDKIDSIKRFNANSIAAFREMHRFITFLDHDISYSSNLIYKQKFHLFDFVYFIDGKGRRDKHSIFLCPAISEFINVFLIEGISPTTELPNILMTGIREQIKNHRGKIDIPIYSTFGIHKYIFEIKDLIISYAHKLSRDILDHFISPSLFPEPGLEIQDFIKSPSSTFLQKHFLYQIKENPSTIATDRNSLANYIKFGSRDEDIDLPEMRIDDIDYGTIFSPTSFDEIKNKVDKKYINLIGTESDICQPGRMDRTIHGVLNYYQETHIKKYKNLLKEYILSIMNDISNRKGCLLHAKQFLEAMIKLYLEIIEEMKKIFGELRIEEQIGVLNTRIDQAIRKNDRKNYPKLKKRLYELMQHQLLINCIIKIGENKKAFAEKVLDDINMWIYTFEEGIKKVEDSEKEHKKYRHSKRNIKVWSFVTEPDDEIEIRLYELIKGYSPRDDFEKALADRLPRVNFGELINPDKGYFKWDFDHPEVGIDRLVCTLPAEFVPLENIKNDPIKWNYNFINNFLQKGQLEYIKDITIMDILGYKKINADSLAKELNEKSNFLGDYKIESQARAADSIRGTEIRKKSVSLFDVKEPGKNFALLLKDIIGKEQSSDIINFNLSHEIIQYRIANYISFSGFSNLEKAQESYRDLILRENCHVFVEERNASLIEGKFKKVLNKGIKYLDFELVDLMGDIEIIRDLIYALFEKWVYLNPGSGQYEIVIVERSGESSCQLGRNIIEVLRYLNKHEPQNERIREEIMQRVKGLRNEIKSKEDIIRFINKLNDYYTSLGKMKGLTHAEEDILDVMKIIIDDEIKYYENLKNKIIL
jgi:hypothetical protein